MEASKFVKTKGYKKFMKEHEPRILIGHARAQTQGTYKDSKNNHPIYTKSGLILIHNGSLWNDQQVIKDFKLKTDGEVDSEVIVRLIEYYIRLGKDTQKAIQLASKKIRGSFACALLNSTEPSTLYIWHETSSPLHLAYHKPTGTVFFASTEDIMTDAFSKYEVFMDGLFKELKNDDGFVIVEAPDDRGYKITSRGWQVFKTESAPYTNSNYKSKNSRAIEKYDWESETPIKIEAQNNTIIQATLADQLESYECIDVIERPSEYMSEILLYRLEYLQYYLSSGDYEIDKDYEDVLVETEVKRIINTLNDRKKRTLRHIYIPTVEEIMDLKDSFLLTDNSNLMYVFSNKNAKLFQDMVKIDPDRFKLEDNSRKARG